MANNLATQNNQGVALTVEQVLIDGDLARLSSQDRVEYYNRVCDSLGLNPYTKPFEYIRLNGRLVLYARKDATEQLRKINRVSIAIVSRELVNGVYVVTARATMPDGRCDESIGAVAVEGLKGEGLANAYMKAETKAKRRVTLSICGLGMLDETEVETIPHERPTVELVGPKTVNTPFDAQEAYKAALVLYERLRAIYYLPEPRLMESRDEAATQWRNMISEAKNTIYAIAEEREWHEGPSPKDSIDVWIAYAVEQMELDKAAEMEEEPA